MSVALNHPAVSADWAMAEFPDARDAERKALLDLAPLAPGMTVLDLQAAGGYLADGIFEQLQGQVELICLEPCRALSSRLSENYTLVEDPVECWSSVLSDSVDIVIGLAGLHHSNDKPATVREAFRVLKPGGCFVVCDVIEDSDMALWLNEYVDANNPAGHKGDFLAPGDLSALFQYAGFSGLSEDVKSVPWLFPAKQDAVRFFKGLFGLVTAESEVQSAMEHYLQMSGGHSGWKIEWRLIYGKALKL